MTLVQRLARIRAAYRALLTEDVQASGVGSVGEAFVFGRFDELLNDEALSQMAAEAERPGGSSSLHTMNRRMFNELRYAWALVALALESPEHLASAVTDAAAPGNAIH